MDNPITLVILDIFDVFGPSLNFLLYSLISIISISSRYISVRNAAKNCYTSQHVLFEFTLETQSAKQETALFVERRDI